MTRQVAYRLLTNYLKNKNLLKHSLAAGSSMRGICKFLIPCATSKEIEKWGITGLLHDIDYEKVQHDNKLDKHGQYLFQAPENLQEIIPAEIVHAIKSHNFAGTKVMPESNMDWAITAVDQLTGLIVACALVHPDHKLQSLTPEFVLKRFNQAAFAKGANRNSIKYCEEKLHIPLEKFVGIVLTSMQEIHEELGL